jgi:hypothetical protein
MAPRVLVCLEDTGVAHVLAARLSRDGIDGVVVSKPAALADEARKGVAAVVLQDRYASGEVGTSLLRHVRIARGDNAPAVVLSAGEVSAQDRHLLERQWRVQTFLPLTATPQAVADAVRAAAGVPVRSGPSPDRSELDVDIDMDAPEPSEEFAAVVDGAFDDDDGANTALTVEMSRSQLQRLRQSPAAEPTGTVPTTSAESVLSQLPPPGGDNDIALGEPAAPPRPLRRPGADAGVAFSNVAPPTSPGMSIPPSVIAAAVEKLARERADDASMPPTPAPRTASSASSGTAGGTASGPAIGTASAATSAASTNSATHTLRAPVDDGRGADSSNPTMSAGASEGDAMQIQELQRTQAELKKALLAERKSRETAQKRVEELEARLSRMGEEPTTTTQGVPADGVFEDLRYPALLARCRAEGFTGSIVMQTGGAQRTVFLKDGLPVAFSSSEPGQRIGKLLVAQGRITDEQYMKAATLMVERSIKLADALVELRLIDADSLAVEQRNTTRDQIIQGFEFVQGRFQTVAGAAPDANTSTFDFGPGEIYVQGYRRYAPANEMLATYETLRDKYLIGNARLGGHRPKLGLTGDDERFVRLLGEAYTVEEACERCGATTDAVARLLAALQALDLVEEWNPGVEQFRSRLRAERQRHAEDLTRLLQEARAREDKMLDAFQKALAGQTSALADAKRAVEPTTSPSSSSSSHASSSLSPSLSSSSSSPSPSSSSLSPSFSSSSSSPSFSSSSTAAPPSPTASASAGSAGSSSTTSSWRSEARSDAARSSLAPSSSTAASMASSPPSSSTAASMASSTSRAASSLSSLASAAASSAPSAAAASSPTSSLSSLSTAAPPSASTASSMAVLSAPSPSTSALPEPERSPAERKYREGLALMEAKNFVGAELVLRDAVREAPDHAEYLTALARVLLGNPQYEREATVSVVRPLLEHALTLAPDDVETAQLLVSIS